MSWRTSPATRKCTISLGVYTGRPWCGFSFIAFIASIFWSICEFSTGRSIEFQYEFCELFSFCMEYPDNSYRVLNLNTDSIHCQIIYWYTDPTVHSQINP